MSDTDPDGQIVSVNVGRPRTVAWKGRQVTTSIFKEPVEGRRRVEGVNVDGDEQADRRFHGGPDKAVYAYGMEDYRWWEAVLDRSLPPGTFGENLTTTGLAVTDAVVGQRWRVGGAVLRVTQPRTPCHKLGLRMGDERFPDRFAEAGRPGAYLAVEEPGEVGAGDPVRVLSTPEHGLTVGDVERASHAGGPLSRLVDVPDLPESWRAWACRRLAADRAR